MTSQEHAKIMCAMAKFYTSAIETLRRELVSYGAVVSNMANVSQKQRIEISTIAKHLIALQPTFTEQPSATSGISHRLERILKAFLTQGKLEESSRRTGSNNILLDSRILDTEYFERLLVLMRWILVRQLAFHPSPVNR